MKSESFSVRMWRGMLREGVHPTTLRQLVSDHLGNLRQLQPSLDTSAEEIRDAIHDTEQFQCEVSICVAARRLRDDMERA